MVEGSLQVEVEKIRTLTPTVWEVVCRSTTSFSFQAGQYVMLGFPPSLEPEQKNTDIPMFPIALASSPQQPTLEFCIRMQEKSAISAHVRDLRPGDLLQLKGPHGHFLYKNPHQQDVVWIATGTGIAPLRSMFLSSEFMDMRPRHVAVILGVRNREEILYQEEWLRWEQQWGSSSFEFVPVLSQADALWQGERGRVTDYLRGAASRLLSTDAMYYICGHREMLQTVSGLLQQRGISASAIRLSQ